MIIGSIKEWFTRAVPTPTDKNRAVQIGCHFEEVGEMCEAAGAAVGVAHMFGLDIAWPGWTMRGRPVGVAHMFGLDISGALVEVDRANWSKFVDGQPVFDANGKIAKPPTYSPPDLSRFV